jgi:hypothetical protein
MRVNDIFSAEMLLESQNYEAMYNPLKPFLALLSPEDEASFTKDISSRIKWARFTLKRLDRITWFLRYHRLTVIDNLLQAADSRDEHGERIPVIAGEQREALYSLEKRFRSEVNEPQISPGLSDLTHYMGLPCPAIQNYRFDRQSVAKLIGDLRKLEREWIQSRHQEVDHEDTNEAVIKFPDGFAWIKLDRHACDKEADAMGHCGNQYGNSNDRILSLRKKLPNGRYRPSLTFIIDKDGMLGEMKGRANEKPNPRYHPHIIALLKHPMVKDIKGGGYDPQNNFDLNDLTEEQRQDIYAVKPAMMPPKAYYLANGIDDTFKQKVDALLDMYDHRIIESVQFVERGGKPVASIDNASEFYELLSRHGDRSCEETIQMLDHDYFDHDHHRHDDWLVDLVNEFPGGATEQLVAYVRANCGEDLCDHYSVEPEELGEIDDDEVLRYVQEENEPEEVYYALSDAQAGGVESGTHEEIRKALKDAAERWGGGRSDFGGLRWKMDTEPGDDGKCHLYCDMDHFFWLIEGNPAEDEVALLADHYFEPIEEKPSVSEPYHGFNGWDGDYAYQRWLDDCPDECKPQIPNLKDAQEMSLEEMIEELTTVHKQGDYFERNAHLLKDEPWVKSLLLRRRWNKWHEYGPYPPKPEAVEEAHHAYKSRGDSFRPIRRGDTVRVFHGFRDSIDAIRAARFGLSGAQKVGRVYSYEADNNPKGLFVTLAKDVAKQFVGAFGARTIMEFNAMSEELQPPVWPNGHYTVQGQMASYFGHGAEGRRKRAAAKKAQMDKLPSRIHPDDPDFSHIELSDDPMLASTLTTNYEMQALFMGHLSPSDITCFWVEEAREKWKRYSVKQFLAEFGDAFEEKDVNRELWNKVFAAGDEFDERKWLAGMLAKGGEDVEETLGRLWQDVLKAPQQQRVRTFLGYFETFLWPKQVIPAMRWMALRYGRKLTEGAQGMKLHDAASVKLNEPNADFWIVRRGTIDEVGKPTSEYSPEHLGVTVTRTDILDPRYLFYAISYLHSQGSFRKAATGTTKLVNIKANDIRNISFK